MPGVELPDVGTAVDAVSIALDADGTIVVTFVVRAIPAKRYEQILNVAAQVKAEAVALLHADQIRKGEIPADSEPPPVTVRADDIAIPVIVEGVVSLSSTTTPGTQRPTGHDRIVMATEIWGGVVDVDGVPTEFDGWPDWARQKLFRRIRDLSIAGPSGKASPPNGTGGEQTGDMPG